jgi:redox-sensitive bicupin YhaK (pirin superfamily)
VAELLGCRLEQERLWYYVVCGPATMSNQKVAKKEQVSVLSNKETVGTIAKKEVSAVSSGISGTRPVVGWER